MTKMAGLCMAMNMRTGTDMALTVPVMVAVQTSPSINQTNPDMVMIHIPTKWILMADRLKRINMLEMGPLGKRMELKLMAGMHDERFITLKQ